MLQKTTHLQASQTIRSKNLMLLVSKQDDPSTCDVLENIYNACAQRQDTLFYSLQKLPFVKVKQIQRSDTKILKQITVVVVVGDNETLLQVFSYFTYMNSPPILGIASGCVPILYNYNILQSTEIIELMFADRTQSVFPTQNLMKLSLRKDSVCSGEATCQIQIHRGMSQGILILNLYLQNSCSKQKIKISQFRGDGLLISTPIGSYLKSMALNGPLMQRNMENIMITAMCPLSMKFRTLCLPASGRIFITIDQSCRTQTAQIYVDDIAGELLLKKGQQLSIRMSKYKSNMIASIVQTPQEFYIKSLRNILNWGENNLEYNLVMMAIQLQERKEQLQTQKEKPKITI